MPFDVFCLVLAFALAVWGAIRGMVRQVFGALGLIGGVLGARFVAPQLAEAFQAPLGVSYTVALVGFAAVIFFGAELIAKLLGNLLHKSLGEFTANVNRFGGFFLGAVKGLALVWVLASLVALARPHLKDLEKRTPLGALDLDRSQAVRLAQDTNLVASLRDTAKREADGAKKRLGKS